MKQIFSTNYFSFEYIQGVSYTDTFKDEKYKVFYFNQEYTGRVETDFADINTFYPKEQVLVHLYGSMNQGYLKSVQGFVQFQNGKSLELQQALPTVFKNKKDIIRWRPYGKFI